MHLSNTLTALGLITASLTTTTASPLPGFDAQQLLGETKHKHGHKHHGPPSSKEVYHVYVSTD